MHLKLPASVVQVMSGEVAKTFPARLLSFIRTHMPESCGDDTPQKLTIAIMRARTWGLATERDVATYVSLCFTLGLRFDEESWAHEVLSRQDVEAGERIHTVFELAVRQALLADTPLAPEE
jgi:hypothetical protein